MNERLRSEQAFHEVQAEARRRAWETSPVLLRFPSEEYLDHEPWVRPAWAKLGPLGGKRVLDFGCGHGMAATVLAREGADVIAFDLAAGYARETADRAAANGVVVRALVADGARLPFATQSCDAIWGVAILHHLPMREAAREIRRVLRQSGVAVFCEPWGGNPLLQFARRWLPYRGKERTRDEAPLGGDDLAVLHGVFPKCEIEYMQLFGMIRRAWPRCPGLGSLDRFDEKLLKRMRALRIWCRYAVITLRRDG